jgi:hypothetical protein
MSNLGPAGTSRRATAPSTIESIRASALSSNLELIIKPA